MGVQVGRRTAAVVLVLIWVATATGGFTVSAFSGQTTSPGNTFTAAASFAPQLVKELGTSTCGGASSTLTVPAGGVGAGNTVVVVLVLRDTAPAGPVAVTDAGGNSYATDVDFTNSNIRKVILSGRATTALQAGDAVTVTHPDVDAEAAAALEFSGIREPRLDTAAADGGLSSTPTVTAATSNDTDLLVGAAGNVGNRSYTEATAWTTVADLATNCGGGTGRLTLHAAYRTVSSAGSWTYNPTLNANDRWAAGIAAYRG